MSYSGSPDSAVMVSMASGALRRQLRPLAWVTLEEVALRAVSEDGRLVARTSAREVAERLGVDPGTAAGALRTFRRRGLLLVEREHGPTGRFGLSVYVLGPIRGLAVVPLAGPGSDEVTTAPRDPSETTALPPSLPRRPGRTGLDLGSVSS